MVSIICSDLYSLRKEVERSGKLLSGTLLLGILNMLHLRWQSHSANISGIFYLTFMD